MDVLKRDLPRRDDRVAGLAISAEVGLILVEKTQFQLLAPVQLLSVLLH